MRRSFVVMFPALLSSLATIEAQAVGLKRCEEFLTDSLLFGSSDDARANANHLISYLGDLVEHHHIGEAELLRFLGELEKGRVSNPILTDEAESSTALLIHRAGFERLMKGKRFEVERLKEWIRGVLASKAAVRVKRDDARTETADASQKFEFHPIPPRRFQMGPYSSSAGEYSREVELTHSIEVMSTPMTQKQWVELFGENPSKFARGEFSTVALVNGKPVRMQPDNPVERITWWSCVVAANKLSEKHGLTPAYDLSGITWAPNTRAEDGTLEIARGKLKISAPDGDIYRAMGFRLPTEAEQENLIRLELEQNGSTDYNCKHRLRNRISVNLTRWRISTPPGTRTNFAFDFDQAALDFVAVVSTAVLSFPRSLPIKLSFPSVI